MMNWPRNLVKFSEKARTAYTLARRYPSSLVGGYRDRDAFRHLETYCMFIGYPRSGHSLVGSLLDAHPNMIIAHALGALKYVYAGFSAQQIYHLLLENSRTHARRGRRQDEYAYSVPGQWQGRFETLKIIGDKRGSDSTLRLRADPDLLRRLCLKTGLRLRILHVVRNPFDNISTISLRHHMDLDESTGFYFSLCETVAAVKKDLEADESYELQHESFVANPVSTLASICDFLGVDAPSDYLSSCARIVFSAPRTTRHLVPWSAPSIRRVEEKMEEYPFLRGYSFGEGPSP